MKWIIIAILACVVPYTYLNLKYRKPNPAHQPYADNKERANVMRLLAVGYQRFALEAVPLPTADSASHPSGPGDVSQSTAPGGLPPLLAETLVEAPQLPTRIITFSAPDQAAADAPYVVSFTAQHPDPTEVMLQAVAYLREDQLTLVPAYERRGSFIRPRDQTTTLRLTLPPGSLRPGTYQVALVGAEASSTWTLQVR